MLWALLHEIPLCLELLRLAVSLSLLRLIGCISDQHVLLGQLLCLDALKSSIWMLIKITERLFLEHPNLLLIVNITDNSTEPLGCLFLLLMIVQPTDAVTPSSKSMRLHLALRRLYRFAFKNIYLIQRVVN